MIPYICCEPCDKQGICTSGRNCCLECHFSLEEELALPYLPPVLQQRLRAEHAILESRGFPPEDVAAHGLWEEYVFQIYCPPEICERIKEDHAAFDAGELVSRDRRRPNPDPAVLRMRRVRSGL